jgi:hypothetical protein
MAAEESQRNAVRPATQATLSMPPKVADVLSKRIADLRDPITGDHIELRVKDAQNLGVPGEWLDTLTADDFDFYSLINLLLWELSPAVFKTYRELLSFVALCFFFLLAWLTMVLVEVGLPLLVLVAIYTLIGPYGLIFVWQSWVFILSFILLSAKLVLQNVWIPLIQIIVRAAYSKAPKIRRLVETFGLSVLAELSSHRDLLVRKDLEGIVGVLNDERVDLESLAVFLANEDTFAEAFALITYLRWAPRRKGMFKDFIILCVFVCLWYFDRVVNKLLNIVRKTIWLIRILLLALFSSLMFDFSWFAPISAFFRLFLQPLVLLWFGRDKHATAYNNLRATIRMWLLIVTMRLFLLFASAKLLFHRHRGNGRSFNKSLSKFRAVWNQTTMEIGILLENVRLPSTIRTFADKVDVESIQDSNKILEELGWPKTVDVYPTQLFNEVPSKYSDELIGSFDFHAGVPRARFYVEAELQHLRDLAPLYMNSFEYATWQNELDATARYFKKVDFNYPDLGVDEVWLLLKPIFAKSSLTPFKYIVNKWEKRYGLGPFWRDNEKKHARKLPRWKAIKMVGGFKNFLELWAKTFAHAPGVLPVAGVSVKGEALPPKKWMADKVRTIISAPLAHYILSTVWNYQPNHNFAYWKTPIKIGLPLNGANLSRLFEEHTFYQNHFAGDYSDFDSTLQKQVLELVKAVRKKGFEHHRDYAKICHLIDGNYKHLFDSTPLAFTSTGNIYRKNTGLSTGHSSTGMDNSISTVVLYLMLWKSITGLSAHEFRHFNKLSCYGDDHLLSWTSTSPPSWTKHNMISTAKSWGLTLRDEAPLAKDVLQMEFLSKSGRVPTAKDKLEFQAAKLPVPQVIVFHNGAKLIGKATAPIKNASYEYRLKRIISYLDLCAHHKDIYTELRKHADMLNSKVKVKRVLPTYEDILVKWYNPKSVVRLDAEIDIEDDTDNKVLSYGNTGLVDQLLHALSIVPDLLNPVIFNQGYVDWLISRLGKRVAWPIHLIKAANDCSSTAHIQSIGRRTPYEWLVVNPHVYKYSTDVSMGGLLVKHWLFTIFKWPDSMTPKAVLYLRALTKKLSDLQFAINGKVWIDTYRAGVPLWDMSLVFLLSFIPDVPAAGILAPIVIPNPVVVVEQITQAIVAKIWHVVPPNLNELGHTLDWATSTVGSSILVTAPTGTGKSTSMIAFIMKHIGGRYTNVVVVSPRVLVAETTSTYMRDSYGIDCVAVTGSSPFARKAKLMYVTPVEVFLHPEWNDNNTYFIVDECHLNEPLIAGAITYFKRIKASFLITTATPSKENVDCVDRVIELRLANVWSKTETRSKYFVPEGPMSLISYSSWFTQYAHFATDIVRSTPAICRFLIFCPSIADCKNLEAMLPRKCCLLNSNNRVIDPNATIFIATSVADVGLTLPDIDWMISSDITIDSSFKDKTSSIFKTRLNTATLTQRAGRVGRTSNGYFSYFLLPSRENFSWMADTPSSSLLDKGYAMLAAGVPMSQVSVMLPEFIHEVMGVPVNSRNEEALLDLFVKNSDRFFSYNELHRWTQVSSHTKALTGLTKEDLVEAEEPFVNIPDFGIIFGGGQLLNISNKPVVIGEFIDNIILMAKESAKRSYEVKPSDVSRFILANPFDGRIFVNKVIDLIGMATEAPVYHFGSNSNTGGVVAAPYVSLLSADATRNRFLPAKEESDDDLPKPSRVYSKTDASGGASTSYSPQVSKKIVESKETTEVPGPSSSQPKQKVEKKMNPMMANFFKKKK